MIEGADRAGAVRLLVIGDVFGEPGRRAVQMLLPGLRDRHDLDVVICNGENAARGTGLTTRIAKQLLDAGVDGITLGNHAYRQRDIFPMLNTDARIVRPVNFPAKSPGKGLMYIPVRGGGELAVINAQGQVFLDTANSPWEMVPPLVERARISTPLVLVDFHAEATSEKVAMGRLLDGAASAVVGTHTHVQTSDARILHGGTAYITDLGMTGPHDSVIGVKAEIILRKLTTQIGERYEPAERGVQLEGALIELDRATGRASSIESLRVPLPD